MEKSDSSISVTLLPVEALEPNLWNPNFLTEQRFKEYVDEVRHLGQLPKPVVVRRRDDGRYEIVDGEHGWRAAKELGFAEVPCEVVQVGDFEARRQTYKRNQHGRHDPLREGRMFDEMLALGKQSDPEYSQRRLAKEMDVSQGKIHLGLQYVEAAAQRQRYAGECRDEEIAMLTARQVRKYLDLPDSIANIWLDVGGAEFLVNPRGKDDIGWTALELQVLTDYHLEHLVKHNLGGFRDSVVYAVKLGCWIVDQELAKVSNAREYAVAVADLKLPVVVLDHLPRRSTKEGGIKVCLTPEAWQNILVQHANAGRRLRLDLIDAAVQEVLEQAGVPLDEVYGNQLVHMRAALQKAPPFIREADFLTVQERWEVHCLPKSGEESEKTLLARKKEVVERLRRARVAPPDDETTGNGQWQARTLGVKNALEEYRKEVWWEHLYRNRGDWKNRVLVALKYCEAAGKCRIGGRPAIDVLSEQLYSADFVESPLIPLLGAALIGSENQVELAVEQCVRVAATETP